MTVSSYDLSIFSEKILSSQGGNSESIKLSIFLLIKTYYASYIVIFEIGNFASSNFYSINSNLKSLT